MADPLFNSNTASFLTRNIHELSKWVKRYEKFSPETRFLMLIDKIQMILMAGKLAAGEAGDHQIEIYKKDDKLTPQEKGEKIETEVKRNEAINLSLEIIQNEFNALEDFIQSDSRSILKKMESKLDEFLEGPDYKPGQKVMQEAKKDFDGRVEGF